MDGFGAIVLLVIAALLYFLPTIIGWNKKNADSIAVINFFLGWTFLGWVVALAMAVSGNEKKSLPKKSNPDKLESLKKLKDLLDSGALNAEEYEKEKRSILDK